MSPSIRFLRLAAVAMAAVFLSSPARVEAFGGSPGGPYSNGSYFPTEGTFQATIRAVNLSGVATFNSSGAKPIPQSPSGSGNGTSGNGTSGSSAPSGSAGGTFVVSYQGTSYSGNVDGSIDPKGGSISAVLEGSSGSSSAGNSTQTVVDTINSDWAKVGVRNVDMGTRAETLQENVYEIIDGGTGWELVTEQSVIVVPQGTDPNNRLTLMTDETDIDEKTTIIKDGEGNIITETKETNVIINKTSTEVPITLPSITENVTQTVAREYVKPSKIETFTVNKVVTLENPDRLEDVFGYIDTIATTTFSGSPYASGFFNAKLKNSFPNQILNGDGIVSFTQVNESAKPVPVLSTVEVPIKVRGVRISDTTQNYTAKTIQKPTVVTSTVVENRP